MSGPSASTVPSTRPGSTGPGAQRPASGAHTGSGPERDRELAAARRTVAELAAEAVEQRAVVRGLLLVHAEECGRADALAAALAHLVAGCTPSCGSPAECRVSAEALVAAHRRTRAATIGPSAA